MYKTIVMPSGCFRNGIELTKRFATLNSSPRMAELFIDFDVLTGVSQPEPAPFCR